jgi:hypothetical protein
MGRSGILDVVLSFFFFFGRLIGHAFSFALLSTLLFLFSHLTYSSPDKEFES